MARRWLLYGAYGYTGSLIAQLAADQGYTPVLAGRREKPLREVADPLGLEYRVIDLHDSRALADEIAEFTVVLHCAGPFAVTSTPMIEACLAANTHYVDITGEIEVFAHAHGRHNAAVSRNVVLVSGAGFDVVPSDCLAAQLKDRMRQAQSLTLAFDAQGGPSPGTLASSLRGLSQGGRIRRKGTLTSVPLVYKTRTIPFPHGPRSAVTIPWGDVYTAFVSTGIPDIEVYMALPERLINRLRWMRLARPLLSLTPIREFLEDRARRVGSGPGADTRAHTRSYLWGEVRDRTGQRVEGGLITPNGYDLTGHAALGIVDYLLTGEVDGGYYTPSALMGSTYVNRLPGVEVRVG